MSVQDKQKRENYQKKLLVVNLENVQKPFEKA